MAKFDNFSERNLAKVGKIYKVARQTLEAANADFDSQRFRTAFTKYMGNLGGVPVVKKSEERLKQTIRAMHMRAGTLSFSVVYEPTLGANADMWNPQEHRGKSMAEVQDAIDTLRSGGDHGDAEGPIVANGGVVMRLGPAVWDMPFTSRFQQSQVETFLHELSHHAAGTIDDTMGGECYDLVGVNRLKGVGPVRAVRNAENVGFFLMEYAPEEEALDLVGLFG